MGGKSNSPSRTATNSKYPRDTTPEKEDSQQTISGGLQGHMGSGGPGNGVLVVHRNESAEERLRRLKGKAIMQEDSTTMVPKMALQGLPQALLTRDRGTVIIREGGIRSPLSVPRLVQSPHRNKNGAEDPSLDLDTLMNSKHIDEMVITREEEKEVDKLADEFGDVGMDETTL